MYINISTNIHHHFIFFHFKEFKTPILIVNIHSHNTTFKNAFKRNFNFKKLIGLYIYKINYNQYQYRNIRATLM